MDKEKQIKEIFDLIKKRIGCQYIYKPSYNKYGEKEGYIAIFINDIAKDLYNANCRILDKGSMVLTKKEFWKLSNKFSKKELDEIIEFHKKKTYKQAVTEVLNKLHNKGQKFFVEAYSLMEDSEYEAILNEIAKEFGVEIQRTDEENQITEMTKIIKPILENRTDIGFIPDLAKPIAKELIKHYQPRLPKDNEIAKEMGVKL